MPEPSRKKAVAKGSRAGFLSVGQTARILGISSSTLRLWENVGLISPARSTGHYRLYDPEMLDVLKRIKYLRDVKKLNVPGIKDALGSGALHHNSHPPEPKLEMGGKLRQLRQRFNLGIVEAAHRARISPGFLSAIELCKAHPSIATLQRLTATYNTTVLEFFNMPQQSRRLIRPDERQCLSALPGTRMELLSVGTKMLECMLFCVQPKCGSMALIHTPARNSFTCWPEHSKSGSTRWSAMCSKRAIVSGLRAISVTVGSTPPQKKPY
jgi:DNA-binding transcriptional MerR regulator